jgi:hypothetical protein
VSTSADSCGECTTKWFRAGFVAQNQHVLQVGTVLAISLLVGLFASPRVGDLVGLPGPAVRWLVVSAVVGVTPSAVLRIVAA